jgi:hypothetical protein
MNSNLGARMHMRIMYMHVCYGHHHDRNASSIKAYESFFEIELHQ